MRLVLGALIAAAGTAAAFQQEPARDGDASNAPPAALAALATRKNPLEEIAKVATGRFVLFGRAAYGVPAIAALEARLAAEPFDLVVADVGVVEGEDVQAWITEGKGDLEALLASLEPWSFARAETRALLESLRARNAKPEGKKVRFAGIGPIVTPRLVERAIVFADQVDPDSARRCASLMGPLRQIGADGRVRWFEVEASERYLTQVGASELLGVIRDPGRPLPAKMTEAQRVDGLRDLDRLNQGVESLRVEVEAVEHDPRGSFLAANLRDEIARSRPDARVLVLVHARDLARASDPDSFGALWKDGGVSIGSAFGAAKVRAIDPNALAKGGKGFATIELDASGRTELERTLSKAGAGVFELRGIEGNTPLAGWLLFNGTLRGARTQLGSADEAPWPFTITRDFDALAFVAPPAR